ncbi:ATP-dependent helicase [Tepidimicrobium xylanilyticum]|uniref:DNA 3'-5' helicase n=1 Tax=Tepidimicrobium xylanilyticum TaxID=1123352 RepID=A0A1H2Z9T9_9FIRM|nr:ATP-dependent helicase [Tepidimicrobium xylanilyticum]GMG96429.1 DNA helicase [Tepidimicrobium xylanilyticum]SDX14263.1 DNA helicase-2 / ATP-dependent DNA helicase PcrA [Tepidimicrobium xylanilyticum]
MNLSKEQQQAISHVKGPALVLAVPGAGKTTVLIHRTANLILNEGVSPQKILSVTFSRASAKDMKGRFNSIYGDITNIPVHFSTIHSFSYGVIREYAYKNRKQYTLIEDMNKEINKVQILRNIYLSINKEHITEEKLESIINSIGYIKNMLIGPEEYLSQFKLDISNFLEIFHTYESYKKNNHLIDFDDMLTLALKILREDKYLLEKYRKKYEYIQVDEGQDTSKVQLEIIKILAHPKNNLFIVADDDQSIYGFRGAYPKGLFEFNKIYGNGKIFFMEENYRSSKNIVSVSNKFIKKNTLRFNKNIFTKNQYFEPIKIVKVKDLEEEYRYLMEELININDYANTAILYRNNLSAIGIIECLERNSIPFYIKDINVKFFDHWLVQDIVDFFQLANDSSNIAIFEKIYYKMNGFISKKQINYIKTLYIKESVFDSLLSIPGLNEFYRKNVLELKLNFKKLSMMNPYEGISFIEKSLGYGDYLKESHMRFGYTMDSLKTILNYLRMIASNTEGLKKFFTRLKYLEYLCNQSKNTKEGITLSTIHSAKGLEFNRVYIIDLIDGDFPTSSSIDAFKKGNIGAMEEERRLFYVGMTRAKKYLTLITYLNKDSKKTNPSRFLLDLEAICN